MQLRSIVIRAGITAAVLIVFLLHVWGIPQIRFLAQLENIVYDARVRLTMPRTPSPNVVIVDIDERSIGVEGHWPWPRDRLAHLTEQLFERYGIRALGYDINFPESDRDSGAEILGQLAKGELADNVAFQQAFEKLRPSLETDALFADAIKGRNVVLGYVFRPIVLEGRAASIGVLPPPVFTQDEVIKELAFLEPEGFTGNLRILQDAAANGGFFDNPVVDQDGVYRRVPALQMYEGDVYASLGVQLARAARGWPEMEFAWMPDRPSNDPKYLEYLLIGDLRVPVDRDLALYVPYRGPSFTIPYVSATDVLHGTANAELLRDKIVIVGTSAPGLYDMRVTPVSETFIGVEVHANIVDGILTQRLKSKPYYIEGARLSLLVLLAVLMTFIMARWSVVPATLATALLVLALIGGNLVAWQRFDLIVPLAPPLLFVLVVFVLQILYGLLIESRGKRHLSQMFGQYIPPELVEEMDRDRQEISLEGESREMSVLFSDVRGFTGVSEGLEPKQLAQLMNEFLTPLTRAIHERRGTIDKYMGDAVMAFWGAPLADEEHASHAVAAALEMVAVMHRLGPEFRAKGWPELKVGVGVNTGLMNVGNMGSQFRMAYTVMGDAVNLGSRLEALTRTYAVEILVSEATRDAAPEFTYLELDRVRVKGKAEAITIFEPLGLRDSLPKELKQLRARHKQALMLYREQQWDAAEREFFSLAQSYADKPLYRLYLDRIAYFRQHPPPADWEGVFTFSTK
ncbi:MAG TPA: adenylate/guanylate cyclase domain-containing protein [Gammaproteobacteria bacterium]